MSAMRNTVAILALAMLFVINGLGAPVLLVKGTSSNPNPGERAYAAMRLLSGRAGHTMEEDGLPARFSEPLPSGASADHPVEPSVMKQAISDYYAARGFDRFGPTDETLRKLGMDDCIGKLQRG